MLVLVLLLTFVSAASLAAFALAPHAPAAAVVERARAAAGMGGVTVVADLDEDDLRRPMLERTMLPAIRRLGTVVLGMTPEGRRQKMQAALRAAGRDLDLGAWLARKALLGVVLAALGALVLHGSGYWPVVSGVAAFLGWRWPDGSLERAGKERRKVIAKALPDVLDLLCVSVEAGLGFDGAMQKVAEKFPGPVAAEFGGYLRDVRLGQGRDVALRAMAQRCGVPELQTTVAVVIQAERLGASLARVLRVQSDELRVRRRQAAQERALQIPVKLIFPLVLFIFPAIFVVLLGPAALHVMTLFTHGN
jgi:tight adherence protein C